VSAITKKLKDNKAIIVLGPGQTGKSTLLQLIEWTCCCAFLSYHTSANN